MGRSVGAAILSTDRHPLGGGILLGLKLFDALGECHQVLVILGKQCLRWLKVLGRFPVIFVKDVLDSLDFSVVIFEFVGHEEEVWRNKLRAGRRCLGHREILVKLLGLLVLKVGKDLRRIFVRALVDEELFGTAKGGSAFLALWGSIESVCESATADVNLALRKVSHG